MIHTDYGYEVRSGNRLLRVCLYGEIDHHSAAALRQDLDELLLRERPLRLVLDLSRIEFMDSSGLGLILGRYTKVNLLGGILKVANPNDRIEEILKMAGTDKLIPIEKGVKYI